MRAFLALMLLAANAPAATPPTRFGVDDLARLVDLTEPVLSPDGNAVLYVATSANPAEDKSQSDLWRVHQDGTHRMRLTDTPKFDESRQVVHVEAHRRRGGLCVRGEQHQDQECAHQRSPAMAWNFACASRR